MTPDVDGLYGVSMTSSKDHDEAYLSVLCRSNLSGWFAAGPSPLSGGVDRLVASWVECNTWWKGVGVEHELVERKIGAAASIGRLRGRVCRIGRQHAGRHVHLRMLILCRLHFGGGKAARLKVARFARRTPRIRVVRACRLAALCLTQWRSVRLCRCPLPGWRQVGNDGGR